MLLADKAAGKQVRDEDVLYYRKSIELDREYLDNNARLDAQELFEQRQRQAAGQAQQVAHDAQQADRRRSEREAARQAESEFRERVAEHEELLRGQMAQHAANLDRMLADDASLTRLEVLDAILFATSLMEQEDADQLGPLFGQVRRWVMDAEDPDGLFSTSSEADGLSPESFVEEIQYREAVAAAVAGDHLLQDALVSWDPLEKARLALRYPDFDANLSEIAGPGYDDSLEGWTAWFNEKRKTLEFHVLDTTRWEYRRLFALPLPSDVARDMDGRELLLHGASKWWAVDSERQYCILGQQLYSIADGQVQKAGQLQLNGLDIFGTERPVTVVRSDYHVYQQLVVLDGRPVWAGTVQEGSDRASNGEAQPAQQRSAYVSIDLSTNQLMWRDLESNERPPGGWQFDSSAKTWWTISAEDEPVDPAPAAKPAGGLLQRLFSTQPKPVKQATRMVNYVIERDALAGRQLRKARIDRATGIMNANMRLEPDGRLSVWGDVTRLGYLDRATFRYVADEVTVEPQPLGTVGDGPLHVLQQTLRFHGGQRDSEGELLPSAVRLVQR